MYNLEHNLMTRRILAACLAPDGTHNHFAQDLIAKAYEDIVSKEFEKQSIANLIFSNVLYYTNDDVPEIPIDIYFGIEQFGKVWSNSFSEGVKYNEFSGADSFRFRPIYMTEALAWGIKYNQFNYTEDNFRIQDLGVKRMINGLVYKSKTSALTVLAQALGGSGKITDISSKAWRDKLKSFLGSDKITDIFVSPEKHEFLSESPLYNEDEGTYDKMKIHTMLELGVGAPYQILFQNFYSGDGWTSAKEIIFGINNKSLFSRAMQKNENGNVVTISCDDQFNRKDQKWGLFSSIKEAWVVNDGIHGVLV